MKKFIKIISLVLALTFVFCACGSETGEMTTSPAGETTSSDAESSNPLVKFTMENGGSFVVELYPEYAPATVDNFVTLVSEGFYDGLTFHRVVENFMAQGGDPDGTGNGGSSRRIKGEFINNGFTQNTLSHTRGVISMARSSNPNSASSQFFICYGDATFLDGDYAAFGMVTQGMEVVDSFLEIERTMGGDGALSSPVEPIVIEKAEVVEVA